MARFVGFAIMIIGMAILFSARIYPMQRANLERWGARAFLGGLVVWAVAFRLI
ncbi:MAG: hypothetical protein KGL11_04035 [Alphaproteobacteria bacterium]|nr:hypothetical protein [Alphaproteobacteria bacterium]